MSEVAAARTWRQNDVQCSWSSIGACPGPPTNFPSMITIRLPISSANASFRKSPSKDLSTSPCSSSALIDCSQTPARPVPCGTAAK